MLSSPNSEGQERFSDKQTDKRIHELLLNEEDHISEADIQNIRTDVAPPSDEDIVSPPRNIDPSDPDSAEHKDLKDDTDPRIDNDSWNVLEGNNAG